MPFSKGATSKAYEDGDFIFGIADAVAKFKTAKANEKRGLADNQPMLETKDGNLSRP